MPRPRSKKKPTTSASVPTTSSSEVPPTLDTLLQRSYNQLLKEYGRLPLDHVICDLIYQALHRAYPNYIKEDLACYERVRGDMRQVVDADYICYSILLVCEMLRSKDPNFRDTSSRDMAKIILRSFPKSDMLQELKLVDAGYLSFKLNGKWMARKIYKNLIDGIHSWAPIFPVRRVVIDSPEHDMQAEDRADDVRSTYIRHLLARMLEYSGVEVCGKVSNEQSLKIVKKDFPEENGVIRNRRTLDSLFDRKEEGTSKSQQNHVHEDLAALWYVGKLQKANWVIYVTPVRQREYILKCFDAAKYFVKDDQTSLRYLGYQTSVHEKAKLNSLWNRFNVGYLLQQIQRTSRLDLDLDLPQFTSRIAISYGSPAAVFKCIIRYHYLKRYTYCDCTFEDEEIFEKEGNNFMFLLETRYLIRAVIHPDAPNLEPSKALVGEEREFGLHLLRFTEVIIEAVLKFRPHVLCEYLYHLSKNIYSLIRGQEQTPPSETLALLCKAAEVVLEKSFDLLGITPETSDVFWSCLQTSTLTRDHYIALPVLRPNYFSSRFEMFSMSVGVDIEHVNLHGEVSVSDMYGVAQPDMWSDTDVNGCGQVPYFTHEWYNPIAVRGSPLFPIPFGNPASCISVPFSKSMTIACQLWFSSKEKNDVYQLCNIDGDKGKIKLEQFWRGKPKMERSTFQVEGVNGCLSLYYYLIKEAVDTSISLRYMPIAGLPKARGSIRAYYGDGALDSCPSYDKNFYKALIFDTGPTTLEEGNIKLNRSTLAVPKNGVLVLECSFQDVHTGKTIMKSEHNFSEECKDREWITQGGDCRFILTVDWNPAPPLRRSI